jgi:hypothetical protein
MIHDLVNQNVKVENGRDLVDPLLQLEQIVNLPAAKRTIYEGIDLSQVGGSRHSNYAREIPM